MSFNFSLDKDAQIQPMYKQLADEIVKEIQKLDILPGDKLPAERELALQLGISRGTVVKAYEDLVKREIAETIQGKGSFVMMQDNLSESRKEKAVRLISGVIEELQREKFSLREIRAFFDVLLLHEETLVERIEIGLIDCNPESLNIFEKQLTYIGDVIVNKYLTEDLLRNKSIDEVIKRNQLFIVTSTHLDEIRNLFRGHEKKLIQVSVSSNHKTIIALAKIDEKLPIAVLCETKKFKEVIARAFHLVGIQEKKVEYFYFQDLVSADYDNIAINKKYLIIPAFYPFNREMNDTIDEFIHNGGKVVYFEYQIERGGMIFLEESILKILESR